jgi:hypothetical protein
MAAAACVGITWCAFSAYIAPIANASDVHFKMYYLAAFGIFSSVWVGVACQRRARFLVLLSVAGLAVFVLHFVPF